MEVWPPPFALEPGAISLTAKPVAQDAQALRAVRHLRCLRPPPSLVMPELQGPPAPRVMRRQMAQQRDRKADTVTQPERSPADVDRQRWGGALAPSAPHSVGSSHTNAWPPPRNGGRAPPRCEHQRMGDARQNAAWTGPKPICTAPSSPLCPVCPGCRSPPEKANGRPNAASKMRHPMWTNTADRGTAGGELYTITHVFSVMSSATSCSHYRCGAGPMCWAKLRPRRIRKHQVGRWGLALIREMLL